jgi:hypothetical protein
LSASVATGWFCASRIRSVTTSLWRSLTLTVALRLAQPQPGETYFETLVPVTGLLTSLRCSVIANAAAVAKSRPMSTAVERTRCKAR